VRRAFGIVRGALAAIGLLFVVVTFTPLDYWWIRALEGPWNDPKGEILIVPGADIQSDGVIGIATYWRTVYAARFWHQGGWREVVVSGGGRLALAMRDFLIAYGVPPPAVLVENAADSTRENAVFTARLLHGVQGRLVLETSEYHMYRAVRAFRKAGLNVQPRPVPDLLKGLNSRVNRWPAFLRLCVETSKIVYYEARGWI